MREDGSIAMTKLNMSVVDRNRLISPEALLVESFTQQILDRVRGNQNFFPYEELEFLDESQDEERKSESVTEVNLSYDLTFEMVEAHLHALEKEANKLSHEAQEIINRADIVIHETPKNSKNDKNSEAETKYIERLNEVSKERLQLIHDRQKVIESEKRILERSRTNLENNSRYSVSPSVKRILEYKKADDNREKSYSGKKRKNETISLEHFNEKENENKNRTSKPDLSYGMQKAANTLEPSHEIQTVTNLLDNSNEIQTVTNPLEISHEMKMVTEPSEISREMQAAYSPEELINLEVPDKRNSSLEHFDVKKNDAIPPEHFSEKKNGTTFAKNFVEKENGTTSSKDFDEKENEISAAENFSDGKSETTPPEHFHEMHNKNSLSDFSHEIQTITNPLELSHDMQTVINPLELSNEMQTVTNPLELSNEIQTVANPIELSYEMKMATEPSEISREMQEAYAPEELINLDMPELLRDDDGLNVKNRLDRKSSGNADKGLKAHRYPEKTRETSHESARSSYSEDRENVSAEKRDTEKRDTEKHDTEQSIRKASLDYAQKNADLRKSGDIRTNFSNRKELTSTDKSITNTNNASDDSSSMKQGSSESGQFPKKENRTSESEYFYEKKNIAPSSKNFSERENRNLSSERFHEKNPLGFSNEIQTAINPLVFSNEIQTAINPLELSHEMQTVTNPLEVSHEMKMVTESSEISREMQEAYAPEELINFDMPELSRDGDGLSVKNRSDRKSSENVRAAKRDAEKRDTEKHDTEQSIRKASLDHVQKNADLRKSGDVRTSFSNGNELISADKSITKANKASDDSSSMKHGTSESGHFHEKENRTSLSENFHEKENRTSLSENFHEKEKGTSLSVTSSPEHFSERKNGTTTVISPLELSHEIQTVTNPLELSREMNTVTDQSEFSREMMEAYSPEELVNLEMQDGSWVVDGSNADGRSDVKGNRNTSVISSNEKNTEKTPDKLSGTVRANFSNITELLNGLEKENAEVKNDEKADTRSKKTKIEPSVRDITIREAQKQYELLKEKLPEKFLAEIGDYGPAELSNLVIEHDEKNDPSVTGNHSKKSSDISFNDSNKREYSLNDVKNRTVQPEISNKVGSSRLTKQSESKENRQNAGAQSSSISTEILKKLSSSKDISGVILLKKGSIGHNVQKNAGRIGTSGGMTIRLLHPMEAKALQEKIGGDTKVQYVPISMDYGTSYPDLLKNMIDKEIETGALRPMKDIVQNKSQSTSADKFLRGEIEEVTVDDTPAMKTWNNPMVRSTGGSMRTLAERGMNTLHADEAVRQAMDNQVSWVNPAFAGYGTPESLTFKNNGNIGNNQETPQKRREVRISEAEIRRTADRVFKMVEERIRKERRRIGRI